jgi:phosphate transport system substrate-binding protein
MICSTVALLALLETAAAQDLRLIGSGASFPLPIYSAWFKQFSKQTRELIADCQPKGSAGIQDFINHTVDFAGRDAAMTAEEMAKANGGVALIPIAAGEIVIAYNLPGAVAGLRLPRNAYPEIFLGKVTRWNDPRIAAANPKIKLPDLPITVVRSDASGTPFGGAAAPV